VVVAFWLIFINIRLHSFKHIYKHIFNFIFERTLNMWLPHYYTADSSLLSEYPKHTPERCVAPRIIPIQSKLHDQDVDLRDGESTQVVLNSSQPRMT